MAIAFVSYPYLYLISFRLIVVPNCVDDDQLKVVADYRSRYMNV